MGKGGKYGRRSETSRSGRPGAKARGRPRRRRSAAGRRKKLWRPWRAGWPRRAPARKAAVFPKKESLQVLRREDGLHRLQARGHPVTIRAGARPDSAAPHDGSLLAPPALARRSHQARAQHCAAAVCRQRRRHASAARHSAGRGSRGAWPYCARAGPRCAAINASPGACCACAGTSGTSGGGAKDLKNFVEDSDLVIPNGVCEVRNPSSFLYSEKRIPRSTRNDGRNIFIKKLLRLQREEPGA